MTNAKSLDAPFTGTSRVLPLSPSKETHQSVPRWGLKTCETVRRWYIGAALAAARNLWKIWNYVHREFRYTHGPGNESNAMGYEGEWTTNQERASPGTRLSHGETAARR